MDQMHKPTQVQLISSCFTSIEFSSTKLVKEQNKQSIIMGDDAGTYHVFKVPSNLFKKQEREDEIMKQFWERETRRYMFRESRIKELKDAKAKEELKAAEKELMKGQEEGKTDEEILKEENDLEEAYNNILITIKETELNLITHDEAEKIRKDIKEAKKGD